MTSDVPPGLPRLWADPRAVKQILINLLSNATKFTARGGAVTVFAAVADDGALGLTVKDTGVGMTAEDLSRAMQRFGRGARTEHQESEGSGLGLPLTEALVALHKGDLKIDTRPGAGTVATVRFPPERTRPIKHADAAPMAVAATPKDKTERPRPVGPARSRPIPAK